MSFSLGPAGEGAECSDTLAAVAVFSWMNIVAPGSWRMRGRALVSPVSVSTTPAQVSVSTPRRSGRDRSVTRGAHVERLVRAGRSAARGVGVTHDAVGKAV